MLASNRNIGQQILSRFRRSFHQIVISFPIHGEHKNVFFKIDLNISLLWLVKRGGRNSHDLYNKDFTTFYSRKIHKGKFIRFVYSYDEQWDGFRYIFKFTIFDLEEECRAFLKAYFNSYSKIISKCKTFARVSKSLCAEIAVYRSRNFVLLERRSLRIDWLTQIPYHFGCKFGWVSKSRSDILFGTWLRGKWLVYKQLFNWLMIRLCSKIRLGSSIRLAVVSD